MIWGLFFYFWVNWVKFGDLSDMGDFEDMGDLDDISYLGD